MLRNKMQSLHHDPSTLTFAYRPDLHIFLVLLIILTPTYLHMKKRMKEMMQRMLMMTAIPTKTVAALKAGERMVPKSSRRPLQISVPSWLKFRLVKLCSSGGYSLFRPKRTDKASLLLNFPTQFYDLQF